MTERERLIKLIHMGIEYARGQMQDEGVDFAYADVADHLLANGVIVPPCKVGETVYRIVEMGTGIHYKQVGRYEVGCTKGYKIVPCKEKKKRFIRSVVATQNNFFDICENFGKTVFLTEEDAKKALKERQEK